MAWSWSRAAADGNPAKPAEKDKAAEKDPFQVPDGTIEELQKYVDGLNRIRPSSSLRPAIAELHKKRATAQLGACEKILAAKPTPEQTQWAVRVKVAALLELGRLGDDTAQVRLEATGRQVEGLGLKDMVRSVQLAALQNRGEHAVAMTDLEYGKFVERLKAFLTEGPLDGPTVNLAVEVAMAAERSNRPGLAEKAYRELGKAIASSNDEKDGHHWPAMLGAARRLDLVGKPFVLNGATLAGKPLDWKKYRGKVVLIDFFATWCGPCREEVPNIMKCYNAYRNRGFDVIAVSVDHDRKAIEDSWKRRSIPGPSSWTVTRSAAPTSPWPPIMGFSLSRK